MKAGDQVTVTNIDNEEATGEIVEVTAHRTSEYEVDFLDVDGATLADYWRGQLEDPDCPVVRVQLGERTYDYPAERVEVMEE